MIDQYEQESTRPPNKIYKLTVRGSLEEDWTEWFNGTLISTEHSSERYASTTFTCKVRDQAELIGIINWLHNMNLIIECVSLNHSGV